MAKFSKTFKFELRKAIARGEAVNRKQFIATKPKKSQRKARRR